MREKIHKRKEGNIHHHGKHQAVLMVELDCYFGRRQGPLSRTVGFGLLYRIDGHYVWEKMDGPGELRTLGADGNNNNNNNNKLNTLWT